VSAVARVHFVDVGLRIHCDVVGDSGNEVSDLLVGEEELVEVELVGHTRDVLQNNSSSLVHLVDVVILIIHDNDGHFEGRLVTVDGLEGGALSLPGGDGGVLPADVMLHAQAVVFFSRVLELEGRLVAGFPLLGHSTNFLFRPN